MSSYEIVIFALMLCSIIYAIKKHRDIAKLNKLYDERLGEVNDYRNKYINVRNNFETYKNKHPESKEENLLTANLNCIAMGLGKSVENYLDSNTDLRIFGVDFWDTDYPKKIRELCKVMQDDAWIRRSFEDQNEFIDVYFSEDIFKAFPALTEIFRTEFKQFNKTLKSVLKDCK